MNDQEELAALRVRVAKDRLAVRRMAACFDLLRFALERRGVDRQVLASAFGCLPAMMHDGQRIPGA
jgi:hypothetical protein